MLQILLAALFVGCGHVVPPARLSLGAPRRRPVTHAKMNETGVKNEC